VNGRRCHRLSFVEPGKEWELWIEAGDTPLLRRIAVNRLPGHVERGPASRPISTNRFDEYITFSDWKTNTQLPPELFILEPPENVDPDTKAFRDVLDGYFADERYPLLGQPAPAVKLPILDGGTLNLSRYRGKNVVVLDFWATWCVPCVRSLPGFVEVADDFEAKGVRLFAVDLKEDPTTVRDWLAKNKINCPVALDPKNRCKEAFHIQLIPAIVVIDKAGVVRSYSTRTFTTLPREKRLREELEALLAGGQLRLPHADETDRTQTR